MSGALISGLSAVLEILLNMAQLLVISSVIISWVNADPSNQIVQMIQNLSEPMFRPFRKLTANLPGPIDWAPLCVLLIIVFLQRGLIPYLKILAISP